jgi:hypothetical protein
VGISRAQDDIWISAWGVGDFSEEDVVGGKARKTPVRGQGQDRGLAQQVNRTRDRVAKRRPTCVDWTVSTIKYSIYAIPCKLITNLFLRLGIIKYKRSRHSQSSVHATITSDK